MQPLADSKQVATASAAGSGSGAARRCRTSTTPCRTRKDLVAQDNLAFRAETSDTCCAESHGVTAAS